MVKEIEWGGPSGSWAGLDLAAQPRPSGPIDLDGLP